VCLWQSPPAAISAPITSDRIHLTTWVRSWVAGAYDGAREEGMTLSAYLAQGIEDFIMDPEVDPEHPAYRGPPPEPTGRNAAPVPPTPTPCCAGPFRNAGRRCRSPN